MDPDLRVMWPAWRLIMDGIATLVELKTSYSYDDMARANAMLDMKIWQEKKAAKKMNKGQK